MQNELLVFNARLPDREYALELRNPSAQQAADALFTITEATRQIAFEYSPIKWEQVRALCSAPKTLSPSQLVQEISSLNASRLEEKLAAFAEKVAVEEVIGDAMAKKPKGEPLEIAFSAYLATLFDRAFPPEAIPWQKPSEEKREVRLVANYAGWRAVKKVDVAAAERKEVVAACTGIFERAKAKASAAMGSGFEIAASAFLQKFPERKSFSRLSEILQAAERELPEISASAGGSKQLEQRMYKLFFYACFERSGFTPCVSTGEVSRIWPELKIPKPRGNYGGKKKA